MFPTHGAIRTNTRTRTRTRTRTSGWGRRTGSPRWVAVVVLLSDSADSPVQPCSRPQVLVRGVIQNNPGRGIHG